MVIRKRCPAHFKYPKANQHEMTFLVSGMANLMQDFIDVQIIKCMFLAVKEFQVINCTCSEVIDETYRQFVFRCLLFGA